LIGREALYIESPVIIDAALRAQLDAFSNKDETKTWAWLVQTTREISEHDFRLLTRTNAQYY